MPGFLSQKCFAFIPPSQTANSPVGDEKPLRTKDFDADGSKVPLQA